MCWFDCELFTSSQRGIPTLTMTRTHSGVCHSDMGVMENSWANLPFPVPAGQVGGHEGVGIVHKLGPGSENGMPGRAETDASNIWT